MKALMLACTLGIAATAEAQVNIELYRGRPGVTGKVNVYSGGATGNSEFFDGGATANVTYTTETYSVLFVGRGLLGFASGERFSNEGLGHLRYTWIEPRRFWRASRSRGQPSTTVRRTESTRAAVGAFPKSGMVGPSAIVRPRRCSGCSTADLRRSVERGRHKRRDSFSVVKTWTAALAATSRARRPFRSSG